MCVYVLFHNNYLIKLLHALSLGIISSAKLGERGAAP
jgi:hypothetical protein